MPLFRRNNRPPSDDEARQRSRAAHPSAMGRPLTRVGRFDPQDWAPAFDESDWAQIRALLAGGPDAVSVAAPTVSAVALAAALERLSACADGTVQAKGPVVDQLLDIWVIANDIDREVARPAEQLLFALVGRDLVGAGELCATCNLIHAAASRYGV